MNESAPIPAEFFRPIPVDRIGPAWQTHKITAEPSERAALAERFALLGIDALTAELRVRRVRAGQYVALEGSFAASVVQSCVVTLEPVPASLSDSFSMSFGPIDGSVRPRTDVLDLDPSEDEPDPIEGNEIDLGEAVAQHLALALDPYPRSEHAVIPEAYRATDDDDVASSPFAGLDLHKRHS